MWRTDTVWFDLALFMTLVVIGSILLGHFEEYKSKWRRLLKVAVAAAIFISLAATLGRTWAYAFLTVPLAGALAVHCWWLPRHGINGWTGEPRDKYLELVGAKNKPRA
jgi:hypothetical protein